MDSKDFFRASKARTERGYTTFDIALESAINDLVIPLPGTLFFLDKSSTGICTVEGNVGQGTSRNPLLASPGFSMFNEQGFADFRISAAAQPGKVLKVVVATGMSIKAGDPVQSGAVATPTVDQGLARTVDGKAFLNTTQTVPVAAQYSYAQIWNPAGSGKRVIIEALSFGSSVAATFALGYNTTQLATLYQAGRSKNVPSGANSSAEGRVENNAGLLITAYHLSYQAAAGAVQTINFKEPVILQPGSGYVVQNQVVNTGLNANFEYLEGI